MPRPPRRRSADAPAHRADGTFAPGGLVLELTLLDAEPRVDFSLAVRLDVARVPREKRHQLFHAVLEKLRRSAERAIYLEARARA